MWAHSGSELFFVDRQGGSLIAAEVETGQGFRVLQRETLFALGADFGFIAGFNLYDIGPDDERFLTVRVAGPGGETGGGGRFVVVVNWFEELRERMGN